MKISKVLMLSVAAASLLSVNLIANAEETTVTGNNGGTATVNRNTNGGTVNSSVKLTTPNTSTTSQSNSKVYKKTNTTTVTPSNGSGETASITDTKERKTPIGTHTVAKSISGGKGDGVNKSITVTTDTRQGETVGTHSKDKFVSKTYASTTGTASVNTSARSGTVSYTATDNNGKKSLDVKYPEAGTSSKTKNVSGTYGSGTITVNSSVDPGTTSSATSTVDVTDNAGNNSAERTDTLTTAGPNSEEGLAGIAFEQNTTTASGTHAQGVMEGVDPGYGDTIATRSVTTNGTNVVQHGRQKGIYEGKAFATGGVSTTSGNSTNATGYAVTATPSTEVTPSTMNSNGSITPGKTTEGVSVTKTTDKNNTTNTTTTFKAKPE